MSNVLKKYAAPLGSALMGLALVLAVSGASLVLTGNSAFAQEDGGPDERVLVGSNRSAGFNQTTQEQRLPERGQGTSNPTSEEVNAEMDRRIAAGIANSRRIDELVWASIERAQNEAVRHGLPICNRHFCIHP